MSKPFLIVNVVEGELGVIRERQTWDEAVNTAVEMAAEQCDTPKDSIREETEADGNFEGDGFKVYIAQTESD